MLYLEDPNHDFVPWTGQKLNDIKYPLSIESSWTAEQLAAINLHMPVETSTPEGKIITSKTVKRIDGVVKYVYTYSNVPERGPDDFPLSDRQLRLGLVMAGFDLNNIQAAINAIPDPTQKIVAQIWWDRSTIIEWSHVMTQSLIQMVGLNQDVARAMWMAAKDLEA